MSNNPSSSRTSRGSRRIKQVVVVFAVFLIYCCYQWQSQKAWLQAPRYNRNPQQDQPNIAGNKTLQKDSFDPIENGISMARESALTLFEDRQAEYFGSTRFNANATFYMRGMGYAFHRHSILLSALLPDKPVLGQNVVRIFNTLEETPVRDCHKWTLWVRVAGPEIHGGSAIAENKTTMNWFGDKQECHWEFPFQLQVPGDYHVDVRILSYNGYAPANVGCEKHEKTFDVDLDAYPISVGFLGFKFYSPWESCCDICAREPGCVYWTTPPLTRTSPNKRLNGCELFFHENTSIPSPALPTRKWMEESPHVQETFVSEFKHHPHFPPLKNLSKPFIHGKPHGQETSYFAGCGWSFWHTQDYPCLNNALDDSVDVYPSSVFTLEQYKNTSASAIARNVQEHTTLPQCTQDDEVPMSAFTTPMDSGRWVRLPWNMSTCKPMSFDKDPATKALKFVITDHDGENPICWHRDDLSKIGHVMAEVRAHLEYHHPWLSKVHEDKKWFAVWKRYNCDYMEFTDKELQKCVNDRHISRIQIEGASIAAILRLYMEQRLRTITLFNTASDPLAKPLDVTLSTLKVPHVLWHDKQSEYSKAIEKMGPTVNEGEEKYFVTGFYYSSEREPFVTVEHAQELSLVMQKELIPRGWKMINGFDVTAALTYDVAGQFDGMHMMGPASKMILTKFFHHLCRSTKMSS